MAFCGLQLIAADFRELSVCDVDFPFVTSAQTQKRCNDVG